MFGFLRRWFASYEPDRVEPPATLERHPGVFGTETEPPAPRSAVIASAEARSIKVRPAEHFQAVATDGAAVAMDSLGSIGNSAKAAFAIGDSYMPDAQLLWYASQGFIGYQLCAIIAQHWLVEKACSMPARDAMRNGYKITSNDGTKLTPEVLARIAECDKRYGVRRQCVEFVKMSRVFGIRIALFKVDSTDPLYYEQPFNPDGVTPGSYKGIVQVDPYWCYPELSQAGATNPASPEFYEPTFWVINGKRYHKSHLCIARGPDVPDILKPSYLYGGLSVPQRIYERVYAAERTANEAPQLALTKRTMVFYTDTAKALANQAQFEQRLNTWAYYRDNFAVKVADKAGDEIEQQDTNLTDLDVTIMTQFQLVAAIANVPATKLLGTTPKGFNATGEYEEANYHEELESIQANDAGPLIARHHLLLARSEGLGPLNLSIEWNPLDTPTEKEEADVRLTNAQADNLYATMGAVDGHDVRARLIADPKSGYNGLSPESPGITQPEEPPTTSLDASDFDAVTGTYAEAELITNQSYLDPAIVAQKIAEADFTVQLSPEFITPAGKRVRVIIDGHHSLMAAVQSGNVPVFLQSDYEGSDYRNALTQLPAFGSPEVAV